MDYVDDTFSGKDISTQVTVGDIPNEQSEGDVSMHRSEPDSAVVAVHQRQFGTDLVQVVGVKVCKT